MTRDDTYPAPPPKTGCDITGCGQPSRTLDLYGGRRCAVAVEAAGEGWARHREAGVAGAG